MVGTVRIGWRRVRGGGARILRLLRLPIIMMRLVIVVVCADWACVLCEAHLLKSFLIMIVGGGIFARSNQSVS